MGWAMSTPADELLKEASVLVVIGPGGVGKTTLAAALGARAAKQFERRVLVVTVDPARRLADALGTTGQAEESVLVPVGGAGRLWTLMVDMSMSWDRLVTRHAPSPDVRDDLLENRLYRALTEKFVQSHDYIALDRLVELVDDDTYDLVVIDTPPSIHALGVLDAPDHMISFFGSRLLTWLTAPYRNRLVRTAAAPFLSIAERLLGGAFLAEVADFFWLFSQLQPAFVRRAEQVKATLASPATRYIVVQTPEDQPALRAAELGTALRHRGLEPAMVLVNRSPDAAITDLRTDPRVEAITDHSLREAVRAVAADSTAEDSIDRSVWSNVPIQAVSRRPTGPRNVAELISLLSNAPDRDPLE